MDSKLSNDPMPMEVIICGWEIKNENSEAGEGHFVITSSAQYDRIESRRALNGHRLICTFLCGGGLDKYVMSVIF